MEKPVPRPPTPCIPIPETSQEENELALILIQRVIRGRAIQTKVMQIHIIWCVALPYFTSLDV